MTAQQLEINDSLVRVVTRLLDLVQRDYEELREAILENDARQARRVDALHTRIDEMEGKR